MAGIGNKSLLAFPGQLRRFDRPASQQPGHHPQEEEANASDDQNTPNQLIEQILLILEGTSHLNNADLIRNGHTIGQQPDRCPVAQCDRPIIIAIDNR